MISSIDELLQYPLQKVSHKVMMVDEYLQKIFDSHNLLGSELQVSVLLAGESISMSSVKYHGLDNTECNIADVLHRNNLVIVFSTLDDGDVGAGSGVTRLVFTLFEQFRSIHLKQIDLFSHVIDPGINHIQSLFVLCLTLDVNLHE